MSWPWSELGLSGPSDPEAVKHAYAQRLKTAHPEEDPEGFQRLHAAYQAARRLARRTPVPGPERGEDAGGCPAEPAEEAGEREEGAEDKPEEERAAGFDYQRLFAEGERERQEARRRRARQRLDAARERRRRAGLEDAALESEEAESAALAALQALDVLWESEAGPEAWTGFLHRETFLNAQHNLDFVFGLEDFLLQRPELSQEIKRKIFLAYRFFNGRPKGACMGLYRLLLDSYRQAGRRNRAIRRTVWERRKPFVLAAALILALLPASVFLQLAGAGPAGSSDYSDLEAPAPDPGSEAPDRRVPLEGGSGDDVTSLHSLVVSYAASDFPGLYAITGSGTAENGLGVFDWMQCTGKNAAGEELVMNYYLSGDGKSLYCIPDSRSGETVEMECTHTWRGISVYRCVDE